MMTEQEAEKAYLNMTQEDRPDLWNRIETGLEKAEGVETQTSGQPVHQDAGGIRQDKIKKNFIKVLKEKMFGGSTFRAAVSVCAVCLIVCVAAGGLGSIFGLGRMGSSSSVASSDEVYDQAALAEDYGSEEYADEAASEGSSGLLGSSAGVSAGSEEAAGTSDAAADISSDSAAGTAADRKLIRTIDLNVETKSFDAFIDDITAQTEAAGGYVESSGISGTGYESDSSRWAEMVLRIPQDQTDIFLENIGDEAKIVYKSESTEDVTLTYVDIESHIDALETEKETLLGLLEKAEAMDEILEIQNELTNVRYELESYQSQLKTYDNQIEYDTITLNIQEVDEVTPYEEPGIGTRIIEGLKNSFENLTVGLLDLLVDLIVSLPYIAVFFIAVYLIVLVIRKITGINKKK